MTSDLLLVAAAAGELEFLRDMVVLFAFGAVLTYLCRRLRLVPIVGFLVAGVVVGPHALGLIEDQELITSAAEIGVILLLFTIGIEFSLEKLGRIKRFVLWGGGLQVGLTIALATAILMLMGIDWRSGIYVAFLVALSSTAIVLKILSDRGAIDTVSGQISLGILIFQDLAIIPMALLIPMLAPGQGSSIQILLALLEAGAIIVAVLLAARKAVPWILDRVAAVRSEEVFLLSVVVICLGIAWIVNLGGVSLALGAFLAGLAVSESRFREHAVGEILPLRTIFNAVFFVSVGMLLDLRIIFERPALVLGGAALVLGLKFLVTGFTTLVLGYPLRIALAVALALAQIGEFSLVLAQVGRDAGLSPAGMGEAGEQAFLGVAVLLLVATPFVMQLEPLLQWLLEKFAPTHPAEAPDDVDVDLSNHVIIGGYGLAGRYLERLFNTFGVPFVIVDLNPVSVLEGQARGSPVIYGDLSRVHTLRHVGVERARLLVIAINDPQAASRIVPRAKLANPGLEIIARAPYLIDVEQLVRSGADVIVTEEMEAAFKVVEQALQACGIHREEAERQIERLRAGGIPD